MCHNRDIIDSIATGLCTPKTGKKNERFNRGIQAEGKKRIGPQNNKERQRTEEQQAIKQWPDRTVMLLLSFKLIKPSKLIPVKYRLEKKEQR